MSISSIYASAFFQYCFEDFGNHPLVCGPVVFQSERHYFIVEGSIGGDEWGFGAVFLCHGNLIVARVHV